MKRTLYLLIIILIKPAFLFSQGFYVKASSSYGISTTNQKMPQYFSYEVYLPSYSGNNNPIIYNLDENNFSIASGVNFEGAVGYSFNSFVSFELRFSTFSNTKKEFGFSPFLNNSHAKTLWNIKNYSVLPTILFGQSIGKSTIKIFVYSGLGISKLNVRASIEQSYFKYKFYSKDIFSWGYGLEYSYSISKKFGLFTTLGINNTSYTPYKARLTSYAPSSLRLSTSGTEINYVDNITKLPLTYNGAPYPNKPDTRLKQTIKLNSICWGIGIKYTFKK
jgi:hypothetical protein